MILTMPSSHHYRSGTAIFNQGDVGDCAYVVEHGTVDIVVQDGERRIHLATCRPGDLFGEMAIIDDEPRSAAAVASSDCTLLRISREQLNLRMNASDPVVRLCMSAILGHLRRMLRSLTEEEDSMEGPLIDSMSRTEAIDALRLEQALSEAVVNGEFELHYQPIINLKNGDISGFEGLIRWRHPERGLIPPGAFIPTAERTGVIVQMTNWAFKEGCRAIQRLQEGANSRLGKNSPPLFMAINFSGLDFVAPGFNLRLSRALSDTGVAASRMKLEVTETMLIENQLAAREALESARKMGAQVAIDDFGTGYSSLSYLKDLPADTLKIDRSFVSALDANPDSTLIRSLLGIANDLDLTVVAEGIETLNAAKLLKQFGCQYGQGYYFARPMPEEQALERIRSWEPLDL